MVLSIVRDAIHIKMKLKNESPIISVPEFSYAAGLCCKIMGLPAEQASEYRNANEFSAMKDKVQEQVKESDLFGGYPNGDRLKSLVSGCRIRGELSEEARLLFDMGYEDK